MRKNNIFYAFLSLLFCSPAFASVTIGIPLTEDSVCDYSFGDINLKSDWSTTCTLTYSGTQYSVDVSGIGVCSSKDVDGEGYVYSASLPIGGATCWCKMLQPVVSMWVSIGTYDGGEANCVNGCAGLCVYKLFTDYGSEPSVLKKALFKSSNLIYE